MKKSLHCKGRSRVPQVALICLLLHGVPLWMEVSAAGTDRISEPRFSKERGFLHHEEFDRYSGSQDREREIRGAVYIEGANDALPGASVLVEGTSIGTVTDMDGQFSLTVPENATTLVVSYLGFQTQRVSIGERAVIEVFLQEDASSLDEVIVVGYGTQKKVNLTGAVSQVGSEVFEDRPMPNVTRGLQGTIPNLNIRMTDGKPTRGSSYNVRGTTSIGAGGQALVLIDGVPGDPDLLNPNDIESVSVLKDASSAAIYGARGSFGVVLITTKRPQQERTVVNYTSAYSLNRHTVYPKLVTEGYPWAKVFNESFSSWNDYNAFPQNVNSVFPFSQDYLEELRRRHESGNVPSTDINPSNGNYVYYGNTDWLRELYADNTPSMEQQVSVSGSGDKSSYYISGRYMNQGGIFRHNPDGYDMYNIRARGSIQPLDWLRVENETMISQMDYFFPILNHPSDTPVWRRISDEAFPIAMLRNPDGTLTQNASIVFGSFISGNNHMDERRRQTRNTSRVFTNFLDGRLKVNADFTFDNILDTETKLYTPVPFSARPGEFSQRGESRMNELRDESSYTALNVYGEYTGDIDKHHFTGLLGYNYERSLLSRRFMERDGLINPALPDFSLIDGMNFQLRGGGNEWLTMGGFFRMNYNYDSKYLLEINGRYDGSSKFPQGQQFGFFPSASAGWRLSQEPFWEGVQGTVSDFKLRASYGSLGNGNISPYQFLETMGVSRSGRVLGGIRPNFTQQPNVIPDGLTWEKATTFNVGADVAFFDNKLTSEFDWYVRNTVDMFTVGLPLPGAFGASVPRGNYADLSTKGWEFTLTWRDQTGGLKPFRYDLRFILSDSRSHITRFNNPLGLIDTYYEGMEVGEIWGFVTEGFFLNEEDIANHADQSWIRVSASNTILPGDIKFADLNGDGVIDYGNSTLDDPGDRTIIGNSSLRHQFGFNANADWNNFYLGVFFQGVGSRDWMPTADNALFWGPYNRPYSWHPHDVVDNMWSEENPDAYYPRLRGYTALNSRAQLTFNQTRYLQNAAYIRLKNLTFGYNVPKPLISKLKISDVKVYFTGQNLWVWSPMFKYTRNLDPENIERSDPELASNRGQGMAYPMLKTFTLGLNITF
ncbi:SusC/RagA family TonB-linked outer membrane protein [Negadavirga shengliensis]|uniref:SusC/RagA family TonB-linked outer membrane protein n=1 Tax=Negadavirga shengliensis TaxID=1389218 RepID=A0ABV9T7H5_9BACT